MRTSEKPSAYKIRTPEDHDRYRRALVPIDQAFFASETKWGVGRLERIISPGTFAAYHRGWDAYRVALDACDGAALEEIGPKMIAALAFMDAEAVAGGHQPLAPDTWEHGMPDGTVLVVVRTGAEASAVIRAEKAATAYTAGPGLGMATVTEPLSTETTLPPDLAVTVRQQHEGRRLLVVTMAEVAALMTMAEARVLGVKWEGDATCSGRQEGEGLAADLVRSGFPLPAPVASGLDF